MKADDANTVLAEHHQLLRTLTDQIDAATTGTTQHRGLIDRLLLEHAERLRRMLWYENGI